MMWFQKAGLSLVLLAVLAGCYNEKVDTLIGQRSDESSMRMEQAKAPAPPKAYDPLVVKDRVWAGNSALRLRRGIPLPVKFESSKGIAIVSGTPQSLADIASSIGVQTGIPVRLAPGVDDLSVTAADPAAPAVPGMPAADASNNANSMTLAYEGPLSGLLDHVANYFGLFWRYDGAVLTISRYETRIFMIEALPGSQKVKENIAGDSGGGSEGGGTSSLTQTSETNVEFKVWEELTQTVTSLLGGVGSLSIAPSSGTLTVSTSPEIMIRVAKYIEEENRRLSQQIAINVAIYSIILSDSTEFGTAFNAALKKLTSGTSTAIGYTSATAQTVMDESNNVGGLLSVSIWDGDERAAVQALSMIGNSSRVAQFPMTTLNNRPVSRRIGHDYSYIKEMSKEEDSSGSSGGDTQTTITVTPGVIHFGFSIQVTPRLLDDGRIMLQYSMNLSDWGPAKLRTFETTDGNARVELPDVATQVFAQQSLLKSGSTLVIGGYQDEQVGISTRGVGNAYNYFLGGGSANQTVKTTLVLVITPRVVDVPRMGLD